MAKDASFAVTGPPLTKKTLTTVSEQAEPITFSTTKTRTRRRELSLGALAQQEC